MYMDNIKLIAKNEKELETLMYAVKICSQDIEMEFTIEKCVMLVMKSGKRHLTDRMELPNQDKVKTLREKETHKNSGILEGDHQTSGNEKKKRNRTIGELESYSRKKYIADSSSTE